VKRNLLLVVVFLSLVSIAAAASAKMDFWSRQRKGANFFNHVESLERMQAAKNIGIEYIRLAPNKWDSKSRDFLMGNADNYTGIVEGDFALLNTILNQADSIGLKVVLTTLSLPGCRWKQQNGDKDDARLWKDPRYRAESAKFWKELASRLVGHKAVVGYNILNEPHWQKEIGQITNAGSSPDLNQFYKEVIKAIREVDSTTPVILDCPEYASPQAITQIVPVPDTNTLYAVHMYEPWNFTTFRVNQKRFRYPGIVWDDSGDTTNWNATALEKYFQPVVDWQSKFSVPSSKIIVSEFGCDRRVAGAKDYLEDLIRILDKHHWHWAFYSFREDTWDAMDYELGDKPLGATYWDAVEKGKQPALKRFDNPIFDVIRDQFKKNR
jgi:aryl-phospho-beta-D-glucosidase BglC (GH1 family)